MGEPYDLDAASDERFDRIARLAARMLRAPVGLFVIVDDTCLRFAGASGLAEPWASRREAPLVVGDNWAVTALGAVAYAGVPVRMGGVPVGSLCVTDTVPRDWTPEDLAILCDLAVSVEAALDLRRVARELTAAQEQLADYLDNTPVLVQLSAPDGRITFVNRTWRETLRYAPADMTRLRAGDIVAPDHRAPYLEAVERVMRGEVVPAFDTVFFDASGQRLVARAHLSARFEHGALVLVRGTFEDVTMQRRSDETQTRLVQVLEATTDFVGVASSATGRAVYINQAGRALIGLGEVEDISGMGLSGVYTPAAREVMITTAIPAALRTGIWEGESVVRTRDGQEIPVSQVIIAHDSGEGTAPYISTIMRDIRTQKRKEHEFRTLRTVTDAISDAEDLQTAFVVALDRLCQETGWPYGEVWLPDEQHQTLVQGPVWCPPTPPMVALARASERERYAPGQELPGRVWFTGRPAWMRDVSTERAVAAGLKGMVAVPVIADELVAVLMFRMPELTDADEDQLRLVSLIAAQLGAVMQRKRAEDDLRASEERFRRLSTVSREGIAISQGGTVLEVNAALRQMFGFDDDDPQVFDLEQHVPLDQRDEIRRRMVENIEGAYYTTLKRKDGMTFEAEVVAEQIMYNGLPARIAVVRDVTEWRRVDRMKSEFVSTVSHELRTPLTSIRGALGLLEAGVGGAVAPKGLDLLRVARENSDRLIRLINDLLDLDKIEAGKLDLQWVTIMPSEIVRSTLDGITGMAEQHTVRLVERVEVAKTFSADRDRIVQVLTNLLSNAIKFSPAGASVELEVVTAPGGVRFAIHNEGVGISVADRKRLFARFQQLDAADNRQHGGTGLGLAISKAIVEQHGGRIGVESEIDGRTTFWFELPGSRASSVGRVTGPSVRRSSGASVVQG